MWARTRRPAYAASRSIVRRCLGHPLDLVIERSAVLAVEIAFKFSEQISIREWKSPAVTRERMYGKSQPRIAWLISPGSSDAFRGSHATSSAIRPRGVQASAGKQIPKIAAVAPPAPTRISELKAWIRLCSGTSNRSLRPSRYLVPFASTPPQEIEAKIRRKSWTRRVGAEQTSQCK
jgi:hypothetical protein